jgi:hypothetical protein
MPKPPKTKPEDPNRLIRPETKPHIDREKVALQREKEASQKRIVANAWELIQRKDLNGLFKLMKEAKLTDEQRERLIALYQQFHGISTRNVVKP